MNFIDFFEPVSLEKPDYFEHLVNKHSFSRYIDINTPDFVISNIENYNIALIGIPEERGCYIKSTLPSPDIIRSNLYLLSGFSNKEVKIIDLGNLKLGSELKDTYYGLREVLIELLSKNVFPIIIGGTQDLTYGIYLAFEYLKKSYTLTTLDNRIDISFENVEEINFLNYLNTIILENKYMFEYINLASQACYSKNDVFDLLDNLFYEIVRLGLLRNNIVYAEPFLRDSDIVSIDISSIKYSEAPGQITVSPNGLTAEEICQISRYIGLSDKTKVMGLFNLNADRDANQVTANLIAQIIWYFIDGYIHRLKEDPLVNTNNFTKYIIPLNDDHKVCFYKSHISDRWWIEVPSDDKKNIILSCSEKEYKMMLNNEIPDRWIKIFKKLN